MGEVSWGKGLMENSFILSKLQQKSKTLAFLFDSFSCLRMVYCLGVVFAQQGDEIGTGIYQAHLGKLNRIPFKFRFQQKGIG